MNSSLIHWQSGPENSRNWRDLESIISTSKWHWLQPPPLWPVPILYAQIRRTYDYHLFAHLTLWLESHWDHQIFWFPHYALYHPTGRITHWLGQSNKDDFWVCKQYGRLGLEEKTWNKTSGTGRVLVPVSELVMSSNFFGFTWNEVTNVIKLNASSTTFPSILLFMDTWSQPHLPSLGLNLRRILRGGSSGSSYGRSTCCLQAGIKPWGKVGWNLKHLHSLKLT